MDAASWDAESGVGRGTVMPVILDPLFRETKRPGISSCRIFAKPAGCDCAPDRLELKGRSGALLDPLAHRIQRLRQRGRIGAAALRHVRAPSSLAADLRRDMVEQFARLELHREIGGNAGN